MPRCETLLFNDPDSIVLCGDQPDMVERALKLGVNCIILCQTEAKKQWIQNAHRTCIISTPFDAARVAKLIYQAIPISRHCHTEDTICFHLGDYIDDNLRHVSGARRNALSGDGGAHGGGDTVRHRHVQITHLHKARIANVSLDALGKELFSGTSDSKPVSELMRSDFKEFHISGQNLGVGQITTLDSAKMLERSGEFLAEMRRMKADHGYDMVILMLTDVLLEGTQLLYVGSDDTIRRA